MMDRGFPDRPYMFHPRRRALLIGCLIAVLSQIYFNIFTEYFRVSLSVALLPILLMTVGLQVPAAKIHLVAAGIVLLLRISTHMILGAAFQETILKDLPGAVFYLFYGIIFHLIVRNRNTAPISKVTVAAFCSDFGGNILEYLMRASLSENHSFGFSVLNGLILVALVRSTLVFAVLILLRQQRDLRIRNELEQRYQRLFLMITGLKSELYFMKKNTDEIERVMQNAYQLGDKLRLLKEKQERRGEVREGEERQEERESCAEFSADSPTDTEEISRMAFDIARDVHEIKKDYFRIMQGIEDTVQKEGDEDEMHFRELIEILDQTMEREIENRKLEVRLIFDCRDNFLTDKHYSLMTILKNLLSNAVESIEGSGKGGSIYITEWKEGENFLFQVVDDGGGIRPKNLTKIFRMGYSTKFDKVTGNIYRGVGLAGVQTMVEETLHGRVEVSSRYGEGAKFQVRIPMDMLVKRKTVKEQGRDERTAGNLYH